MRSIASLGGEHGPSDVCSNKDARKRERKTTTPCENEQAQNSETDRQTKRQQSTEFKNQLQHQHHIPHSTQHNKSQQHTSLKRRPTKKHFLPDHFFLSRWGRAAIGDRHTAREQLGHSLKTTEHRAQKRSDSDRARAVTAGCSSRGASL